jgi:erythromycin esterase
MRHVSAVLNALATLALAFAACTGRPSMKPWQPPPGMAPPPKVPAPPRPSPPDLFAANNLGFEVVDGELPKAWIGRDTAALAAVTDEKHGGERALRIRASGGDFRAASTVLTARTLAGKRVRLHGWIKTEQAAEGAVLWLRVDSASEAGVTSDTMFDRPITGTAPWTVATAEVDVPADAQVVHVGAMLFGGGTAWFDDLALEVTDAPAPARIAIEGTVTAGAGAPLPDAEERRSGPPPAEVVAYIGQHGIPLASTEAGTAWGDLAPIDKLVAGARIVALGEATHGTREFFQLKHRLVEYLVAKQGFTVFAIEANQPECRAINDYVLYGKGTARDALAGIYFWTWNTEEVLALIEWMRAWNADPAHAQKVHFAGFDMQVTPVAHATVAALVGKVAPPAEATGWLAPLAALASPRAQLLVEQASPEERGKLAAGLAALARAFDANRKAWTAAAGAAAYADARHDLTILEQAFAMYIANGVQVLEARDLAMADNVGWLLEQTRAKLVVWAHNGHVSNTLRSFKNMGSHLRKRYQQAYVNLGFVFGEGSFQALDFTQRSRPLKAHTLGPPPEHDASVAFSRTGKPLLVLDLRALPRRGPVRDWFFAPHPVRDVGAAFSGEENMTYPQILPQLYDAVIYVDKTTRARPLPSKRNPS